MTRPRACPWAAASRCGRRGGPPWCTACLRRCVGGWQQSGSPAPCIFHQLAARSGPSSFPLIHRPTQLCHPSSVDPPQKPRGFVTYERLPLPYRPVEERIHDWGEVHAVVSGGAGAGVPTTVLCDLREDMQPA